jgi:hypothetical protein
LEVRNREEEEEKDTEMSWTLFWQILALMTVGGDPRHGCHQQPLVEEGGHDRCVMQPRN